MTSKQYTMIFKVLGSLAITGNGLYWSIVEPGIRDSIGAIVWALVIFAIWGDTTFKKVD